MPGGGITIPPTTMVPLAPDTTPHGVVTRASTTAGMLVATVVAILFSWTAVAAVAVDRGQPPTVHNPVVTAIPVMPGPLEQQVPPGVLLPRWDIHFREGQVEPLPLQAMRGVGATQAQQGVRGIVMLP